MLSDFRYSDISLEVFLLTAFRTSGYYVMFIHNLFIFSRGKLTALFVCHKTVSMAAVYRLKMKYDQMWQKYDKIWRTKSAVSFPFEDKPVVNENQSNCPHVHSMYHVIGLKQTVTLKAAKKFVGVAVYWDIN